MSWSRVWPSSAQLVLFSYFFLSFLFLSFFSSFFLVLYLQKVQKVSYSRYLLPGELTPFLLLTPRSIANSFLLKKTKTCHIYSLQWKYTICYLSNSSLYFVFCIFHCSSVNPLVTYLLKCWRFQVFEKLSHCMLYQGFS